MLVESVLGVSVNFWDDALHYVLLIFLIALCCDVTYAMGRKVVNKYAFPN